MRRFLIALVSLAALSGCMQNVPQETSASTAEVVPGKSYVDLTTAGILFNNICLDTMPSFKVEQVAQLNTMFRQHPETGTYYHKYLDLSVKVQKHGNGKACSMVFSSRKDPMELAIGMSAFPAIHSGKSNPTVMVGQDGSASVQLARGAEFTFIATGRNGGRNYYRAALIVPR